MTQLRMCSLAALVAVTLPPPASVAQSLFVDATKQRGVAFEHRHFGTGEKYMPENMAPGVTVVDLNGDDRPDLYFAQGAPIGPDVDESRASESSGAPGNRLFLQQPDGSFEDVSSRSGADHRGYGMGSVAGDYDLDGDLDLYLTNFGANALLRNRGDGTFEDVTEEAGVGTVLWSVGATWFDADRDGDLDLYVSNYVDFRYDNHVFCGNAQRRLRSYCHPDVYGALPDVFYRNQGDGTFREETLYAGFLPKGDQIDQRSKGLGVLSMDFDGSTRPGVLVANDSTMNFVFTLQPGGRFEENGLFIGLGFNGDGRPEASMGIAPGDVDGDGRIDVLLTHLDNETNTLYKNTGGGLFADTTRESGLAAPSLPWVGFGAAFFDADHDGALDLVVANGHIIDNIEQFDPQRSYLQPLQAFRGDGTGKFALAAEWLPDLPPLAGRGLVAADLDRDGDQDLVVAQNNGPALILDNRLATEEHRALTVRLQPADGRPAIGARAVLHFGKRQNAATVVSAQSYVSQAPADLIFGIGSASPKKLEVVWPDGSRSEHGGLAVNRRNVVRQREKKVVVEELPGS